MYVDNTDEYNALIRDSKAQGWQECIEAVRAFLKGYPNVGGDTVIMAEVERLCKEAWKNGYDFANEDFYV